MLTLLTNFNGTYVDCVKVKNHLHVPVDVYYKDKTGNTKLISPVQPGQLFSLPLTTVYGAGQFYFRPIQDG